MVKVNVAAVGIEPRRGSGFVFLKDEEGGIILPIGMGLFETRAIFMGLKGVKPPRPITYDLFKSILDDLNVTITKVLINAFAQGTFFARITLEVNGSSLDVDSRPSDAIALALRTGSPIYVSQHVMDMAGVAAPQEIEEGDLASLLEDLETPTADEQETAEEPKTEIERLRTELKRLVDKEEYEKAAEIRDEIRRLEKEEGG